MRDVGNDEEKQAAKSQKEEQATELVAQKAEPDRLITEMNGLLGSRKVEAMAAVVTRLVQQYKVVNAAKSEPKPESEAHQH